MKNKIAIIPARGGSVRIPRKNIKLFDDKPMIEYSIKAAINSGLFDHIVVSTDDNEISTIAKSLGAKTPFVRPSDLSDNNTAIVPVVAHSIRECLALGWSFEYVCCIFPCVPFIQIKDLKYSFEQLINSGADYCFPVTEFATPIQRALKFMDGGKMKPLYPEYEITMTHDLEQAYHDAGQFYWGKTDAWLHNPRVHSGGIGYIIPNWRVVDIDTPEDWYRAEMIHKAF